MGAAAFDLAAACCRSPFDLGRARAIVDAARRVDWSHVPGVAGRHRIEGLMVEALRRAGVAPPQAIARSLNARAGAAARLGLRQAAESVRLQSALDEAGITNLLLKGTALDMLAWGRIGLKQSWDIDLLVCDDDVMGAAGVLTREGYRLTTPADLAGEASWRQWIGLAKECVFLHRDSGLAVELHWRLADAATLLPGLSARAGHRWVALSPAASVRTMPAEETFAYLCVHGTAHAWSRLKWLADLGALLWPLEAGEVERLQARAAALGAGRCAEVAMRLCARVLRLPAAIELTAGERGDWRTRALTSLSLSAMRDGGTREIGERALFEDRILLSQLLFADGWRFVRAEAARQWISLDDRRRLPLRGPWRGLFHLVRAPLWAWRRLRRLLARLPHRGRVPPTP